ncbi:MAG: hypothetical protein U1F43_26500 [Myxococcota bacterium]
MESTSTYGDPLREQMARLEVPVFRVSTKRTHDAAELFDGVPSMHDAKAAWCSAGCTQKARRPGHQEHQVRDVAAVAAGYELYNDQLMACMGRLKAMLARHFPELPGIVTIANKSTLALLEKYGGVHHRGRGPGERADATRQAACSTWRRWPPSSQPRTTTGMLMTAAEIALMRTPACPRTASATAQGRGPRPVGAMRAEGEVRAVARSSAPEQRGHPVGRGRRRLRVHGQRT